MASPLILPAVEGILAAMLMHPPYPWHVRRPRCPPTLDAVFADNLQWVLDGVL